GSGALKKQEGRGGKKRGPAERPDLLPEFIPEFAPRHQILTALVAPEDTFGVLHPGKLMTKECAARFEVADSILALIRFFLYARSRRDDDPDLVRGESRRLVSIRFSKFWAYLGDHLIGLPN